MPTQSSPTRSSSEWLQLGLSHHQTNRLAEAEACYREILQQEPQHPDALHLLGVIAQQKGDYKTAIRLITSAIQHNPAAADYHYNLGNTYLLLQNPALAAGSYRNALALEPNHIDALHSLANLLAEQNQLPEAEGYFQRVLALQPDHANAHYNLGNAKWKSGDLQAAVACYERATTLNPDRAEFHFNLGRAMQETGALSPAAAAF